MKLIHTALTAAALAWAPLAFGQTESWLNTASHVVMPQTRSWSLRPGTGAIAVERVAAHVKILDRTARTTLDIRVRNASSTDSEAVLLLPIPDGSAVHSFAFEGAQAEPTAEVLARDVARRTYDQIVAKLRDPALLEFAGYQLIRTSVFPVAAGGTQRVRLSYDEILEADGKRIDYVLPRSESLGVATPWKIRVEVSASENISTVYSPSHELRTLERTPRSLRLELSERAQTDPGSFRFSFIADEGGVNATLFAYPDHEVGGGYFLLMAGLPTDLDPERHRRKREVTLVLDRSGSMAGVKLDQALAAARQVIEGLEEGEAFNVIDYSSQVGSFAPAPVVKTRENLLAARQYLANIRPTGGTNIHDALVEALRPKPMEGYLPIVLFLTDGLPTVGRTSELQIREVTEKLNHHDRRVFTFGVGEDVNVPLLDRISDVTRATTTYVLPDEDVEVKVAKVFRRLYGPILSDLRIELVDEAGAVTTRAVRELQPNLLPDLYEGDHLTLLGQYLHEAPLRFRLRGNYLGEDRTFGFDFNLDKASTRFAFVPRLWASRKIAFLVDQIRQAGANLTGGPVPEGTNLFSDPRFAELAGEILRLSTRFGILSEYTSFLAREGTLLGDWDALAIACTNELNGRAVLTRHGRGAVSQGLNFNREKVRAQLNYKNSLWNEANELEEFYSVQQIADRAFLKRGERWIDSRLVASDRALEAQRQITFGSEEHKLLLQTLVAEGRQNVLSLPGEILLQVEDQIVLVQNQ